MSTQVVRVEGYSKGSLTAIGNEFDHNPNVNHRNSDIDLDRSHLNVELKHHEHGFYAEWNDIKTSLNASYKEKKGAVAFEGMVITADKEFFEKLGYVEGQPMTKEMERFFRDSYKWAVEQIGYRGTDKNIIGARVHMDEGTPHLHIYYLPVVEKWREKVYQRDAEGKILRTEKGTPIQAKDDKGKTLYRQFEDLDAPKLARTEFWAVRGGQSSYRQMQDSYQEKVGRQYGLERGEVGSDRKHKTKHQYEHEQLQAKLQPLRDDVAAIDRIEVTGKRIPFTNKEIVEHSELEHIKRQAVSHITQTEAIENRTREQDERDRVQDARAKSLDEKDRFLAGRERRTQEDWKILGQKEAQLKESTREYLVRSMDLEKKMDELKQKEQEVEHLRNLPAENVHLREQLRLATEENSRLKRRISDLERSIEQRVQEATAKLQEAVQGLEERCRRGYEQMLNVVKSVGMLRWDKEEGYKVKLSEKQEDLCDAIISYSAEGARTAGYADLAERMETKYGISNEIDHYLPKVQIQERGGGPER